MVLLKIKRKNSLTQEVSLPKVSLDTIGISDDACSYIEEYISSNSVIKGLRIELKGGGCAGISIHYSWCQEILEKDLTFSLKNALVIIDKKSLSIIGGSTLHAQDYLGAKEFVLLNNPNAKQCSCKKSFSI